MKFRLLISGKELSLPEDFKFSGQKNSPFLSEQQEGSLTFPFTLPNSPENHDTFSYVFDLQSSLERKRSYSDAQLWAEGVLLIAGTFELREMGSEYLGNFVVPPGNIPEKFWAKKLNELPFGSMQLATQVVTTNLYSVEVPDLPKGLDIGDAVTFALIKNNTVLVGTITLDLTVYKPTTSTEEMLGKLLGEVQDNFASPSFVSVLKNTFAIAFGAPITDTYLIQVVLPSRFGTTNFYTINAYPLTQLTFDSPSTAINALYANAPSISAFVLPQFEDDTFYSKDANKFWQGVVNLTDSSNHYPVNTTTQPTRYTIVPQLFLVWFLKKLAELMGYHVTGSILTDYSLNRLVIFNLFSLDKQAPTSKFPFNIWANELKYANHLPAITVEECVNALRNAMGLIFDYDVFTKQLRLRLRSEVMANTSKKDWTNRVGKQYKAEGKDKPYYQLTSELDGSDELAKDTDPTFDTYPTKATVAASGEKYTPISTKISTISVVTESVQIPTGYTIVNGLLTATSYTTQLVRQPAKVKQPGVSPLFSQDKNAFSFRLAFYDDITHKLENQRDNQFIPAPIRYSMAWGGDNGLYNRFWKDYLAFLSSTYEVRFKMVMTLDELANFDFFERVYILGVDYFVKQINYEIEAATEQINTEWVCWKV